MINQAHQNTINSVSASSQLSQLTISGLLAQHVLRMYGWNQAYVDNNVDVVYRDEDYLDDDDDQSDDDYGYFEDAQSTESLFKNQEAYNRICAAILSNPGEVEKVDVQAPLYDQQYIDAFGAQLASRLVVLASENYNSEIHAFIASSVEYAKNYLIYESLHVDSLFNPWEPIFQLVVRGYLIGPDADGMHCMHLTEGRLF